MGRLDILHTKHPTYGSRKLVIMMQRERYTNPFRSTVVKAPKGKAGSHRAITPEERRLIETVPHRLQKAAMIMLYAGLRRGELLALQYDDVVDDVISVDEAVSFATTTPTIKGPKNDSSIRKVPLLEPIKKYFADKDQAGYFKKGFDLNV